MTIETLTTILGPNAWSARPPSQAPIAATMIGEDAEDADLDDRPAEHAGRIDAAEGIERVERVAVEHATTSGS